MSKLTIAAAFSIREELKLNKKNMTGSQYSYGERQVIASIMVGEYDSYEDKEVVAAEDVEFLNSELKKRVE